ncbi:MAG: hypothetical protein A2070_03095 [Bdellovibrionales bacterium GWC1_52_8]|nr:MAG: hypothetical protein A2Z97_04585 [Bdellovibrionales bacterium GWB1_52_6]OFZ05535.1 MAG: hypothetical protein A2X97_11730 [Bdellovibrionales bacterium GWA1_52_35]OFZ33025.1 MAG: hypothetical protein A2070_03095 [Bdellovibrionales bacterium GWC1_52_8]
MENFNIHWFRRDLRLAGNSALQWSAHKYQGRVLGIFCIDPVILARPDFSVNRFGFFLEALKALRLEFQATGGELLVIDDGPERGFTRVLSVLKEHGSLPESISWNRDYEPFALDRDLRVKSLCESRFGIQVHTERDHLLIEPHELEKKSGKDPFYRIYTPFARSWFELYCKDEVQDRIRNQSSRKPPRLSLKWSELLGRRKLGAEKLPDKLEFWRSRIAPQLTISLPPAGSRAAQRRLALFKKRALEDYATGRDFPDRDGTSRLSMDLKNGSLTIAQVIAELKLENCRFQEKSDRCSFLKQLVWREFYYHILVHFPEVERHSFNPKYEKLKWRKNDSAFRAWTEGLTGYPIVDAGMRQLKAEGWMHNRVRMIVASFLTKDLLISWRRGEEYFMKNLIDGDLASNNGGWQWAASTGSDPQPYFRVFNPKLQGERFDPEGRYVKKYVPELQSLGPRFIHEPGKRRPVNYPAPIVSHAHQKILALSLYSHLG